MALYTIKHRCGHEVEHQIYGTDVRGERERKAAWLAKGDCPRCARAATTAVQAAENVVAAELASAEGLPAMTGSEKQVAWATTLRQQTLDKLIERAAGLARLPGTAEQHQELDDLAARARVALVARTEARWWIDRRTNSLNGWLRDAGVTQ